MARVVARELNREITPADVKLEVEPIGEGDFATTSDLNQVLGVDDLIHHKLVERGILAVGGLNQRLELMRRFDAVSGFQDDEAPMFEQKLGFLARMVDPDASHQRLARVVEIAGLPSVRPELDIHDVDLARLIEIADSEEARTFRLWLRSTDSISDDEIREEIRPLHDAVAKAVHGPAGKAVRFLATAAADVLPFGGLAAGALDSFAVDELLPEVGPTAFISQLPAL